MTYPRSQLVPLGAPGVYHCVSRCVRRAFLCGEDRYTGQSFEHRRQWVKDRVDELAEIFGDEAGDTKDKRGQRQTRTETNEDKAGGGLNREVQFP